MSCLGKCHLFVLISDACCCPNQIVKTFLKITKLGETGKFPTKSALKAYCIDNVLAQKYIVSKNFGYFCVFESSTKGIRYRSGRRRHLVNWVVVFCVKYFSGLEIQNRTLEPFVSSTFEKSVAGPCPLDVCSVFFKNHIFTVKKFWDYL